MEAMEKRKQGIGGEDQLFVGAPWLASYGSWSKRPTACKIH